MPIFMIVSATYLFLFKLSCPQNIKTQTRQGKESPSMLCRSMLKASLSITVPRRAIELVLVLLRSFRDLVITFTHL